MRQASASTTCGMPVSSATMRSPARMRRTRTWMLSSIDQASGVPGVYGGLWLSPVTARLQGRSGGQRSVRQRRPGRLPRSDGPPWCRPRACRCDANCQGRVFRRGSSTVARPGPAPARWGATRTRRSSRARRARGAADRRRGGQLLAVDGGEQLDRGGDREGKSPGDQPGGAGGRRALTLHLCLRPRLSRFRGAAPVSQNFAMSASKILSVVRKKMPTDQWASSAGGEAGAVSTPGQARFIGAGSPARDRRANSLKNTSHRNQSTS